jgi:hypothetical protein
LLSSTPPWPSPSTGPTPENLSPASAAQDPKNESPQFRSDVLVFGALGETPVGIFDKLQ